MSLLGNRMKQSAGDNAQQIQGQTVLVGMSYADVKDLCTTLIQSELALYAQAANAEAQKRFDTILDKLIDALTKIDEKYRSRFQEPAIQFAANETFKEFIRSGKEELSDDLIDLMIERIRVEEHTTKQALIDEARQILPKLSSVTISILAILTFSKLIINNKKSKFIAYMQKLSPLLLQVGNPQSMDIAYLEQIRCGQVLSFISASSEFTEMMQKNYSPMFSHPILIDDFNRTMAENGWNNEDMSIALTMLALFETKGNQLIFNYSTLSKETFTTRQQEFLEASNKLLSLARKYTKEEVKQFFLDIDPNWINAIKLFNRNDIKSFIVSPVGYYIGSRKLSKTLGEEIPFSLFYKN